MSCKTCDYYTYEGVNKRGYCEYWKTYYYSNETCKYDTTHPSSGGCFMTTACCEYKGLPDDCYELTRMRFLRDSYLKNTSFGCGLVDLYYKEAPNIVSRVTKSKKQEELLEEIYQKIKKIVSLIDSGKNDEAVSQYVLMMLWCESVLYND